jgi:hypothetical protein
MAHAPVSFRDGDEGEFGGGCGGGGGKPPSIANAASASASLLPVEFAQPKHLFRARGHLFEEKATFQCLPRILLQLVNGYLSLREIGVWCRTSRDIYSTCAFFRCPRNSAEGGIRPGRCVLGRAFSRSALKALLRSPLRIHVTVVDATDPEQKGLLQQGDCVELRHLPYVTSLSGHYRFEKPFDWAEELELLVAGSSSSSEGTPPIYSAAYPPFRSLTLWPHDPLVDGPSGEEGEDDEELPPGVTVVALSRHRAGAAAQNRLLAPGNLEETKEGDPPLVTASSSASPKPSFKKQPPTHAELEAEGERLIQEVQRHIAAWSCYNIKLFRVIGRFSTLEELGLTLIGDCTQWDVSGFSELSGLRTLELSVESPWHYAFAGQISEIIEYMRDVPYRQLGTFRSNALHAKHLQQITRPRSPAADAASSCADRSDIPVLSTLLFYMKVHGDGPISPYTTPSAVIAAVDRWEMMQNETYIVPQVLAKLAPEEKTDPKLAEARVHRATSAPTADDMLGLYSLMPNLRFLDLVGFADPLSTDGYRKLEAFQEVETLCVGGSHPSQLPRRAGVGDEDAESDDEGDVGGWYSQARIHRAWPLMSREFVEALRHQADKAIKIERLTICFMRMETTDTPPVAAPAVDGHENDSDGTWIASAPYPTPLHEVLARFHLSGGLYGLTLNTVVGLKDLSAVALCTTLVELTLTALNDFCATAEAFQVLAPLKQLRLLYLLQMTLPEDVLAMLKPPSALLPSLVQFVARADPLDEDEMDDHVEDPPT